MNHEPKTQMLVLYLSEKRYIWIAQKTRGDRLRPQGGWDEIKRCCLSLEQPRPQLVFCAYLLISLRLCERSLQQTSASDPALTHSFSAQLNRTLTSQIREHLPHGRMNQAVLPNVQSLCQSGVDF